MGTTFGLAEPCFGSTVAFRRDTLDEIGGLAAFANVIQDDYALGEAIRAQGLSVAIPPLVVTHTCAEQTFHGWLAHELRWARTIRSIDPVGHAGSAATHALPWAVLGLILLGVTPLSIGALAAALGSRVALKSTMDRQLPGECGPLWLLPLRDLLSFLVFTASLFGTKIRWRGAQLEIRRYAALQS
jgi:ceramide glucosyltransferase